jgi:RIO kinase 1
LLEDFEPGRAGRPRPAWLITHPDDYEDFDLGRLKAGKEAEVFLVERIASDGRSCVLAHKRYRPREAGKGQLETLGFEGSSRFVNDHAYRQTRRFPNTRDQRAATRMTAYGRRLLARQWPDHEFASLERLWTAGVNVPLPVERTADGLLMQYVGDGDQAAPRLAQAHIGGEEAVEAARQLVAELHRMVAAGFVHGDLSAYNLLWWEGRTWIIDLPQCVEIASHPDALQLLFRDVETVAGWFRSRRIAFDPGEVYAELLGSCLG